MTEFVELQCVDCRKHVVVACIEVVVQPLHGHWHSFFECPECGCANSDGVDERTMFSLRWGGAEFLPRTPDSNRICGVSPYRMPLSGREIEEFARDLSESEQFEDMVHYELNF